MAMVRAPTRTALGADDANDAAEDAEEAAEEDSCSDCAGCSCDVALFVGGANAVDRTSTWAHVSVSIVIGSAWAGNDDYSSIVVGSAPAVV